MVLIFDNLILQSVFESSFELVYPAWKPQSFTYFHYIHIKFVFVSQAYTIFIKFLTVIDREILWKPQFSETSSNIIIQLWRHVLVINTLNNLMRSSIHPTPSCSVGWSNMGKG